MVHGDGERDASAAAAPSVAAAAFLWCSEAFRRRLCCAIGRAFLAGDGDSVAESAPLWAGDAAPIAAGSASSEDEGGTGGEALGTLELERSLYLIAN